MKKIVCLVLCILVSACTYNISMAHTEGTATDTIDDTQENKPDISPNLSFPVMGI